MDQLDNKTTKAGYYAKYLEVETLLSLQIPLTQNENAIYAHDEMLFIIIHQTYELWFKQILYELRSCIDIIKSEFDDESPSLSLAVHRLKRVVEIWKLLNHQVDVLETMTPLDFLDFRQKFNGASGFQSRQFREVEARLGLRMEQRYKGDYYKHTESGGFDKTDYDRITEVEHEPTMLKAVNNWLERMPFFTSFFWPELEPAGLPIDGLDSFHHPFWEDYRERYVSSLSILDNQEDRMREFDEVLMTKGSGQYTAGALRSALFIMLYRDEPFLRLPFELLNTLQEIDEQIGNFRYRHLQMVRRMIGLRVGTGGTSGVNYLEGAVNQNYIYKEISSIVTYMIERRRLPKLPKRLDRALKGGITT